MDSAFLAVFVAGDSILKGIMRSNDIFASNEPYWYILMFPYGFYPLRHSLFFATIYMVVALSAERYQAFCYPFQHKPKFWPYFFLVISTTGTWSKFHNIWHLFLICKIIFHFLTVTLGISLFFHYEFVFDQEEIVNYSSTALNFDPRYKIPKEWFSTITYSILPFFLISIFNFRIYLQLRTMKDSAKYKSAKVLFLLVLVLLFCHSFRIVTTSFVFFNPITEAQTEFCHLNHKFDRPVAWYFVSPMEILMLTINSSINFAIYFCTGKSFRDEFKTLLENKLNSCCS